MSAYLIDGHRVSSEDANFGNALAIAHARRSRPFCLCNRIEPEMYVAHLGATYIVKRMPGTGSQHAQSCPSHERSEGMPRTEQETAISRARGTGETVLKLDFPLSRTELEYGLPHEKNRAKGKAPTGQGLTLCGLLHYLWDEGGLTRWQANFAGRRHWATVRRRLMEAAHGKFVCGRRLRHALYLPEPFYVERSADIKARRSARWANATRPSHRSHPLLLLIGEVKQLMPTRLGHMAVIKQVPDQSFALGDDVYRRMAKHFAPELRLWSTSLSLRMIVMATFAVSTSSVPKVEELALMLTNAEWLPVDDEWDISLLERLQQENRTFAKCLDYDRPRLRLPAAVLLDTSSPPHPLHVERPEADGSRAPRTAWTWRTPGSRIPPFPSARRPPAHAQGDGLNPAAAGAIAAQGT